MIFKVPSNPNHAVLCYDSPFHVRGEALADTSVEEKPERVV